MIEKPVSGSPHNIGARQILVSFANVAVRPQSSCLLRINMDSQRGEWIDVGLGQLLASGVGICADEQYVYHVIVANADFSTHLTVLERHSLRVVHVQSLPEIDDGHSIVLCGDELLVASSGTDQILAYPLHGVEVGSPKLVWSPSDSGQDTHHINSLAIVNGQLLCSAFGPKTTKSWYSAQNGYIRNVTTGTVVLDGLRQPHSVTWHDGQIYFCNSLDGTVNTPETIVAYLAGYSRGIAFGPDGSLYVGTSLSRRPPSELGDVGMFGNPSDEGELHGECALVHMMTNGAERAEASMSTYGNEIYDILVL